MTALIEQMKTDMTAAMKSGDTIARDTLRNVLGAVQNAEKSGKTAVTFDDPKLVSFIQKEISRRRETANEYAKLGKGDRAERETQEADFLSVYVPSNLTEDETREIVKSAIQGLKDKITSAKQMGLVMKEVTPKIAGRFDGKAVSEMVREGISEVI